MGQLIPAESRNILNHLAQQGAVDLSRLQHVARQVEERERVYHRPNETVYETRRTTTEVYTFGDE
jgi:hypothetical protein